MGFGNYQYDSGSGVTVVLYVETFGPTSRVRNSQVTGETTSDAGTQIRSVYSEYDWWGMPTFHGAYNTDGSYNHGYGFSGYWDNDLQYGDQWTVSAYERCIGIRPEE